VYLEINTFFQCKADDNFIMRGGSSSSWATGQL